MADAESAPLDEQVEAFLDYMAVERRSSPRTVESYRRDLRAFRAFLEERRLPLDAGRQDLLALRAYLGSLYGRYAASTVARRVSSLRSFYRFLHRRGAIERDPAALLQSPKQGKGLPRFLTVEDAFRVVEAPSDDAARDPRLRLRDRALLELLYAAGVRVSEAAALTLDRLELGRREARVIGKGDKERLVPLGEPAVRALEAYLEIRAQLCT
ncbi:MAG TPA: site-specific integrase, partial [Polyangiaceae bacterium LLY-WYZ-15_(1-7)]|nr:site-specific integrase [Polyangiaceae bacterium LLY-WYZ-15_(1-7)]